MQTGNLVPGSQAVAAVADAVAVDLEGGSSHSSAAGCVTGRWGGRISGGGRLLLARPPPPPCCCGLLHTPASAQSQTHSSSHRGGEGQITYNSKFPKQ